MKLPVNIPILSFLGRYWLLFALFVVFLGLTLDDALFQKVGVVIYGPCLSTLALLIVVFLRHIFFAASLDEDVRTGNFTKWWDEVLEPAEKVRWILITTIGLFLGICLIVSALAR